MTTVTNCIFSVGVLSSLKDVGYGAGKSTLVKVLSGVYPDSGFEGDIVFEGRPMAFNKIAVW